MYSAQVSEVTNNAAAWDKSISDGQIMDAVVYFTIASRPGYSPRNRVSVRGKLQPFSWSFSKQLPIGVSNLMLNAGMSDGIRFFFSGFQVAKITFGQKRGKQVESSYTSTCLKKKSLGHLHLFMMAPAAPSL